jgi:hypothetical protein
LAAISGESSESTDLQWYQTWKEDLLRDCKEADPFRPRRVVAGERLRLLGALQQVIKKADAGAATEPEVLAAAARIPTDYRYRAAARVQAARQRLSDNRALNQALLARPASDRAIARAYEKLDAIERDRLEPPVVKRCRLAVQRRDCLDRLAAIADSLPEDEQDLEWLAKWKAPLLLDCHDAEEWLPRYRLAQEREAAWRSLEACLRDGDLKHFVERVSNPLLVNYPPVERQQVLIDQRLEEHRKLEYLHRLLERRLDGLRKEDLDFLRADPRLVAQDRPRIESELLGWLNREPNQLKPGSPPVALDSHTAQVRIKWTWPSFDLIGQCWLAVHEKKIQRPDEAGDRIIHLDPDGHRRHQGSGGVPIAHLMPPGVRSVWVAVWPVIDLGWLKVIGAPLHLGPVSSGGLSGRYSAGSARRGS